jgi:hypothetical protein
MKWMEYRCCCVSSSGCNTRGRASRPLAPPGPGRPTELRRRRCLPPCGAAVIVASAGRRAEVRPRRAVGNVSDTHTSPMPIDRPALVRPISEIALIASVEEGPPTPDRQPVPLTQLDLYGRCSARRLPCARRPPNAEATHGHAGWAMRMSRSDAAATRLVTRHGSLRGFVSDSLKGLVSCQNVVGDGGCFCG